jgi:hypothetical protein
MNWKDVKKIIRKELLKEGTEISAGGNKFNLRTGVNKNPTKLGIKIQFEPKAGFLQPDTKDKLEVALQEKLNDGLRKYKIQVNKDPDVPRDEVIGFWIPLGQLKALVIESIGQGDASEPTAPLAPEPEGEAAPEEDELDEMINKEMLSEMRIRDLNEISKHVSKEDFYQFINKGNNILRTLEEAGVEGGKKYLKYLVKHNIM